MGLKIVEITYAINGTDARTVKVPEDAKAITYSISEYKILWNNTKRCSLVTMIYEVVYEDVNGESL